MGLDFRELGRLGGLLAAQILKGADPSAVPIRDVLDLVPKEIVVNRTALAGLKEPWRLPDDLLAKATVTVDAKGIHRVVRESAPLGRTWRIDLIQLNQVVDVEESQEGVLAGFKEAGLVEGRDYTTTVRNAQGDMATVSALIDAALSEHARSHRHVLDADPAGGAAAGAQRAHRLHVRRRARWPRAPAPATPIICPT